MASLVSAGPSRSTRLEFHLRCLNTDPVNAQPCADALPTHRANFIDAAAVAREMQSRGFAVVRQLLSPSHVDALHLDLREYIINGDGNSPSRSDSGMRYYEGRPDQRSIETLKYIGFKEFNHLPEHPAFRTLRELPLHQELEHLARACLSTPAGHPDRLLTFATRWLDKPPVQDRDVRSATPPHQDLFYFVEHSGHKHLQNSSWRELPQLCTMWIALDHVDEENGCLRYRPYSHRWGLLPHQSDGPLGFSRQLLVDSGAVQWKGLHGSRQERNVEEAEVSVSLAPGDCVIHGGCTVHRADANQSSTRHRRALSVVYRTAQKKAR